jgi:chromosome segregation ATPase
MPLIDFGLLEYCRQQKIEGVYGYLIEFVKIDRNVCFAYEIAGMNKLCSLLVEN